MKKSLITIFLFLVGFTQLSCSTKHEKTKKTKHALQERKIKQKIGDNLFLGFRSNMSHNQIKIQEFQLFNKGILEKNFNGEACLYRFLIDDLNFRMHLYFLSNGGYYSVEKKSENFMLDEIIIEETGCTYITHFGGGETLEGECFEEIYRKKLLKLYLKKYNFQKIEKTLSNQQILMPLSDEERRIEEKKPKEFQKIIKEINLPNGKSVMYYNNEKGVTITCTYGFSLQNKKNIEFQKIQIRYLTRKRLFTQINEFNNYKKVKLEQQKELEHQEEMNNAKKKEIFENI